MGSIDKNAICSRFFECFHDESHAVIAKKLGVSRQFVDQWVKCQSPVPWEKLRIIVEMFGLSWDWLIEGREPKFRQHVALQDAIKDAGFDVSGINARFLSLFAKTTQQELATEIGVSRTAVQAWCNTRRKVPWERLNSAVHHKGVTWEWLLEGRDPRFW